MENLRKSTRKNAGVNRSLPSDFVWPQRFGGCDENRTHISKNSSSKSHSSQLSIERKELAIETEKKRQELHKRQQVLLQQQTEINDNMRLIEMQYDLENAKLDAICEARSHKSLSEKLATTASSESVPDCLYPSVNVVENNDESHSQIYDRDNEKDVSKTSFVADWVERLGKYCKPDNFSIHPEDKKEEKARYHKCSTDIEMLCQTISKAITAVTPQSQIENSEQQKFLARQITDRDFPIFDGNPEEWPLFHRQVSRISKLCGYSEEEKMTKLQKCLRGEARSAVAGMILLTENFETVIETLKLRFGRPEYIIEVIISKIKSLPALRDKNMEKIIHFSSEINNLVATMKTLNSKGHMQNPQLLRDFIMKLSDVLKLKWGEYAAEKEGEVDLEDFSVWLGKMAKAACFISSPCENPISSTSEKYTQKTFNTKHERVNTTSIREDICPYCDSKHAKLCAKMQEDDIDLRWKTVTEKKLCFICLKNSHQKSRCRRRKACGENGCKFYHHPLLHNDKKIPTDNHRSDSVLAIQNDNTKVLLRMIPVTIYGSQKSIRILALCDEASTVSIIDEKVVNDLGLSGCKEELCLQWTNDITSYQDNSICLDMKISSNSGKPEVFTVRNVHTVKNLSLPSQTIDMDEWKTYSHLKHLPIENIRNEKPLLLIGQDNINLIASRKVRIGPDNVPIATKCKLGWSLHGPVLETENNLNNYVNVHTLHISCTENPLDQLQELVKQSFSTEAFGVKITTQNFSKDDARAMNIMKKTVRRLDNRFEIGLLWRDDDIKLPQSKPTALQRLISVEKKYLRNENLAKQYSNKIDEYTQKGYARKLTPEEASEEGIRKWYLPHFAVQNPNKPEKIRLVFDAAAKSNGKSLNDFLLPGPDLLQSLVAILWKFRQRKIGFCGDVKDMFLRVMIRKEDRSAQRFLWRNFENRSPGTYEMEVMTFGATCSPVCAQFIKNLNAEELSETPEILTAITKKIYVDDYLDSKDTAEEAMKTISEVRRINALGGFDIVNWMTNSPVVRKSLASDLLVNKKNLNEGSLFRVLGLWWDADEDTFLFKIDKEHFMQERPTKRSILKSLMSLFDPIGFIASFSVRAKILMQDVWRLGIDWDDELPIDLVDTWTKWMNDLEEICRIRIPRCYSVNIPVAEQIELHLFCDSSEKAFASVAYLRIVGDFGVNVVFVAAKTRVAPLKNLSIPRLELQAAVMADRLAKSIKSELEIKIDRIFHWTDSRCVLHWIRGDCSKYKQFVSHRVAEIQENTNVGDWKWVPTKLNVADEATRPHSRASQNRVVSKEWFSGPTFLEQSKDFWPEENVHNEHYSNREELKELKIVKYVAMISEARLENFGECLPNIKRFSSWLRLMRITAWILRFVKRISGKCRTNTPELSVAEMDEAEKYWIRYSQQNSFEEDIRNLKNEKPLERKSKILPLYPQLRDGLLVVGGRTSLSNSMSEQAKHPIILSPNCDYTKLLINHLHRKFRHQGVELVLNELPQKYWVINGRAAVKSIFSSCMRCRIDRAKPVTPLMGQLPSQRLTREIRPFTNVGMDYFGPIFVNVGRRKEKRWGVLFTCFAIRAIHLEISHTLNTDSTIMAIRRMCSRRGNPKMIFCDNGTNIKGAANELREAAKDLVRSSSSIIDTLTSNGIEFKFISPASPHMGGVWERLIGSVKKVLGKILHGQNLRDETLLTLFAEAENIVNSRPLTKISTDPADFESLTPNHFLVGSSNGIGSPVRIDPDEKCLRKEWKKSQMFADTFWRRWVKEYLPTLNKRNKWTVTEKPIEIEDVVILVEDNAPRHTWKLGRIIQTHPGPDGQIRVVDEQMASGIYRRPVVKICKIYLD